MKPDSFISLHNIKLRYRQIGKGKDILFIHGCPGSIEDWDPVSDILAKKYRVTLYDRPGHGYSGINGNQCNLRTNARIASTLMVALNLKNAVVVGHSYGASTALVMAMQNPKNIKSCVLVAPPGYAPVDVDRISHVLAIPFVGKGITPLLAPLLGPSMIRKGLGRAFYPKAYLMPEGFINFRLKLWTQTKVAVTRAKELINLEEDLNAISRDYNKIEKKVFIVQGEDDTITHAAVKLNKDIPNSKLYLFKHTGHYLQYLKTKELLSVIEEATTI